MSYIAQTYNPFAVSEKKLSIDRLHVLADLAAKDIFPNDSYSNYEIQIWVIMRKLIEDEIDKRNHYDVKKSNRPGSQFIHSL